MVQFEPQREIDIEALAAADAAFARALDGIAATQREIDALEARRARQLVDLLELAERVEIVSGTPTAKSAEFVHRSARAELALATRCSEYAAERLLSDAGTLVHVVPTTLDAVASGEIGWRAARVIVDQARELGRSMRNAGIADGEASVAIAGFEDRALEIARSAAPSRLRTRLVSLRERLHPVPAEERHDAARAERRVTLEDVEDGMSWLTAYLPSVEAHAVHHRLTDAARASIGFDAEDDLADGRTLEQRRADLLVDFVAGDFLDDTALSGATAAERLERRVARGLDLGRFAGIRPTVVVTVPVEILLDQGLESSPPPPFLDDVGPAGPEAPSPGMNRGRQRADSDARADPAQREAGMLDGREPALLDAAEPAMLDGLVPIDPVTARRLVANAPSLYRVLVDRHTGVRLDLSRERYEVSPALRMWLRLRDETCRFPGCGRLAKGCDVDHSIDWQHGGETRADNLAHLCRGHHTLKHQTRWQLTQHADGEITWRSPSGRAYSTHPARPFARAA